MILVFIDNGHNLQGCFLERRSHSLDDLCALCDILSIGGAGATIWTALGGDCTSLRPWRRNSHFQCPDFPADLFFTPTRACEPAQTSTFSPPLFKKLHGQLASDAAFPRRGGGQLADKLADARINQGFQLWVCDQRKREIQNFEGCGAQGRKVAMEENRMQDPW